MVAQLTQLRTGRAWSAKDLSVECEEATPLRGVSGAALDMEVILERCAQLPTSIRIAVACVCSSDRGIECVANLFQSIGTPCGIFMQHIGRI